MILVIFGSRPPKQIRYQGSSTARIALWYEENQHFLEEAITESGFLVSQITEVVCGEAAGYDELGKRWAKTHHIPVKSMPAHWQNPDGSQNRSAGFERNRLMADYAEAGIGVIVNRSGGSTQMANLMLMKRKPCYVKKLTVQNLNG